MELSYITTKVVCGSIELIFRFVQTLYLEKNYKLAFYIFLRFGFQLTGGGAMAMINSPFFNGIPEYFNTIWGKNFAFEYPGTSFIHKCIIFLIVCVFLN